MLINAEGRVGERGGGMMGGEAERARGPWGKEIFSFEFLHEKESNKAFCKSTWSEILK